MLRMCTVRFRKYMVNLFLLYLDMVMDRTIKNEVCIARRQANILALSDPRQITTIIFKGKGIIQTAFGLLYTAGDLIQIP